MYLAFGKFLRDHRLLVVAVILEKFVHLDQANRTIQNVLNVVRLIVDRRLHAIRTSKV